MNPLICVLAGTALAQSATQPAAQPASPLIDPCDSAIIGQARVAIELLQSASSQSGPSAVEPYTVTYKGVKSVEAHMMRPGMVRTTDVRIILAVDAAAESVSAKEISG